MIMDNCQCLWKRRSACRASIFGLLFTLGVVILGVELLRMPHALLILLLLPFLETFLNCLANVYQLIPLLRIKDSSSFFFFFIFLINKRKFGTLACFRNELKEYHVYCNLVLYRVNKSSPDE